MTAPRLEIDFGKIHHNAQTLVEVLGKHRIAVTGVTKACLGSAELANSLVRAGVRRLGDSRIENIEAMRRARVSASMTLIRSPMLSQVDRVVRFADVSFNTELDVIRKLSAAARNGTVRFTVSGRTKTLAPKFRRTSPAAIHRTREDEECESSRPALNAFQGEIGFARDRAPQESVALDQAI